MQSTTQLRCTHDIVDVFNDVRAGLPADGLHDLSESKVSALVVAHRELAARAALNAELGAFYAAQAQRARDEIEQLRQLLASALHELGKTELVTPLGAVGFRHVSRVVVPAGFVDRAPREFLKCEPKLQLLGEYLRLGRSVPEGVHLEDQEVLVIQH
jgi:hypothetical protein